MDKVQELLCHLTRTLEHDHLQHLVTASQEALERLEQVPTLDHLERSDRAETIAVWLEAHGVATAWELAPTFVGAGLDAAWLEKFAGELPPTRHADALGWLEARLNLKSLLSQVEQSTGRIAELVKAVKSYTYMDQSPFFTTKPVGTGTGLGLIISNRIVADRHGGEIEFESHPGETRFKVRLPVRRQ